MMSKKAIVGPDEIFETDPKKRKTLQQGQAWGPDQWWPSKRQKTLDEQIVNYIMEHNMTFDDFIEKYAKKNIKPVVNQKREEQQRERERLRKEFEERKRVESLPQNRIPTLFMGKGAYPQSFEQAAKQFSLGDFRMVRDLALAGKLDEKLGISKDDFILWCTGVIDTKCAEQATTAPTDKDEPISILRKAVNLFRGH